MAINHHGFDGKPVPSRLADQRERLVLAEALRRSGTGVMQLVGNREPVWDDYVEIARASGGNLIWGNLLANQSIQGHRTLLDRNAALIAEGVRLYPLTAGRPIIVEYDFRMALPLDSWAFFQPLRATSTDPERLRLLADKSFREAFREEVAGRGGRDSHFSGGEAEGKLRRLAFLLHEISWYPPEPSLVGRRVDQVAAERGVHMCDLMFDLAIRSDLDARFRLPVVHFNEQDVGEILRDPNVVVGLGDGGAHASQLCDACYPTYLLGHWVRERDVLSLERGVHMLTARPAEIFGITDRGILAIGAPADVVVFDPETVGAGPLERVKDLPAAAPRLISRPIGIDSVIVNGTVLPPPGEALPDGVRPGHLLRNGRG